MTTDPPGADSDTLLSRLSPGQLALTQKVLGALIIIGLFGSLFCYGIVETVNWNSPFPVDDLEVYRAIIHDVREGENYYASAQRHLKAHDFSAASVFNWRFPTYAWLGGLLPSDLWIFGGLIALFILSSLAALRVQWNHGGGYQGCLFLVCLLGLAWWLQDERTFFCHELWVGMLLLLAASLVGLKLRTLAVLVAWGALLLREHALPFYVVLGFLTWRNGRRVEGVAWTLGLALFFALWLWHRQQVEQYVNPAEWRESPGLMNWVAWGGLDFVLLNVKVNAWLFYLPSWVAFVAATGAIVGLTHIRGEVGRLLLGATVLTLVPLFVVGIEYNIYWGFVVAPLLAWGFSQLPAAISYCWRGSAGIPPQSKAPAR